MTPRRFTLVFRPSALRQLRKPDPQVARRIKAATEALRDDPRPAGIKALVGQHGYFRLRVGDYRVIYTIEDGNLVVVVVEIGHRRDIYER